MYHHPSFGVIGVLIAVFVVKSMNTSILQWVVVVVIIYSAVSMLLSTRKSKQSDVPAKENQ